MSPRPPCDAATAPPAGGVEADDACLVRAVLRTISTPFRMQPGLQRVASDAPHLHALLPGSALHREKTAAVAAGRAPLAVPGFDATAVLAAVRCQAQQDGLPALTPEPLALQVREDLALLDLATGTIPWMNVCVPTGWAPEEKLGQPLLAIHAPVADNRLLQNAWPGLRALLAGGDRWQRHVWTLSSAGHYDQHPHHAPREPWRHTGGPAECAAQCWLRVERQTFFPVSRHSANAAGHMVFTIRVAHRPLTDAVEMPEDAGRLHEALASMSAAVLAYKGITPARDRLLAWLAARAQGATAPELP